METLQNQLLQGLFYGVWYHFQEYFSHIVVGGNFIGGGNPSIWRKPQTCHKSPTNLIT